MSCVACRCVFFCKISIRARKHKIILPDPLLESRIRSTELSLFGRRHNTPSVVFGRLREPRRPQPPPAETLSYPAGAGRAPQVPTRKRASPNKPNAESTGHSRGSTSKNKTGRIPAGTPNSDTSAQRTKGPALARVADLAYRSTVDYLLL